jgi:magnesium-transporting ATPase (P-type)
MTTIHQTEKGILVITKGAVEVLLDKIDEHRHLFLHLNEKQTK